LQKWKQKQHSNFYSVSDVWETGISVDDTLVLSSAAKVLERHAAGQQPMDDMVAAYARSEDAVMPNFYPVLPKQHKAQAMQRLATQRGKHKY
jgi:hypothetical protein